MPISEAFRALTVPRAGQALIGLGQKTRRNLEALHEQPPMVSRLTAKTQALPEADMGKLLNPLLGTGWQVPSKRESVTLGNSDATVTLKAPNKDGAATATKEMRGLESPISRSTLERPSQWGAKSAPTLADLPDAVSLENLLDEVLRKHEVLGNTSVTDYSREDGRPKSESKPNRQKSPSIAVDRKIRFSDKDALEKVKAWIRQSPKGLSPVQRPGFWSPAPRFTLPGWEGLNSLLKPRGEESNGDTAGFPGGAPKPAAGSKAISGKETSRLPSMEIPSPKAFNTISSANTNHSDVDGSGKKSGLPSAWEKALSAWNDSEVKAGTPSKPADSEVSHALPGPDYSVEQAKAFERNSLRIPGSELGGPASLLRNSAAADPSDAEVSWFQDDDLADRIGKILSRQARRRGIDLS